ncbi:acyl dehydratase [Actinomadura syzygii]|uniref:Acyl dehydratase n=1 Tax=Actinomadura syzygii TaxID=1427538 RepID=A0A5D0UKK2_9ACTN|nr:acyl dehydratase [Actinomadura syzygii]TYC18497.1 acyl dehydratase [Actinomadura syzygii]
MSEHAPVPGQDVTPVRSAPDAIRLLRFGAVTRNAHRIHYDAEFARSEGLDGPVVMAQLHGCLFHRAAAEFAGGDPAAVRAVGWLNRAPACAGDRLTVTGTVREVGPDEIVLDLEERRGDGTVCCRGHAVVARRP